MQTAEPGVEAEEPAHRRFASAGEPHGDPSTRGRARRTQIAAIAHEEPDHPVLDEDSGGVTRHHAEPIVEPARRARSLEELRREVRGASHGVRETARGCTPVDEEALVEPVLQGLRRCVSRHLNTVRQAHAPAAQLEPGREALELLAERAHGAPRK